MPDIIKLLPEFLANQIAAGEVVQRPASIVKELLENSVDAHSQNIQLIIKDAGKQLVQVVDDGHGMSETDARMCFERHATSKISKSGDLFNIRTMGFRGEAMASIAAVAQVELKSRKAESELGTNICIEASEVKSQEPAQMSPGTQIIVKNLFYNVPARRNFLKTNTVEFKHILDEFTKVALAFPEIAFSLVNADQEIYRLPSGKLNQRILGLFGNSYREQIIPCKEENSALATITGYIGKPDFAKKTRGEQFFFVNNRFFRHPYLHHAVMEAFDSLLPEESFPFYVLFIEIDPSHIDVNVHPSKIEIKFDDERSVYGLVNAAIRRSLGTHLIASSIDFESDVNSIKLSFGMDRQSLKNDFNNAYQDNIQRKSPQEQHNLKNWEKMYDFSNEQSELNPISQVLTVESSINKIENLFEKEQLHTESSNLYQIHNTYILSQIRAGIMLIDQQLAGERIHYEKYLDMLDKKFGASQQFLFPLSIELSPTDYGLVSELETEIHALGFSFSFLGKNMIVINGVPTDIRGGDEKQLFEGLIEQFKHNQSELKLGVNESLARAMAKKSSLKKGVKLSTQEMTSLIDQLFACKQPLYSPDGNRTYVVMDMVKIASFLGN